MRPIPNQRIDWTAFFVQFACPHGVRIHLPGIPAGAPEEVRTEKRLVRIVKARIAPTAPFALCRSMSSGPAIIDCVFAMAAHADELAQEIGAAPVTLPPGWATARELLADDEALRLIRKLSAEACPPRLRTATRHRPVSSGQPDRHSYSSPPAGGEAG